MCKVSVRWHSVFLGAVIALGIPRIALAQSALTWAKVETLRNRVHLIPNGRRARSAQVSDIMRVGDALRTASSARAELRFNDGSLARVGEQATFRFTPDTRNFQLSDGTVLLLIPPGHGRTTIQTPNAVTGIQGSALFVRVRCLAELSSESDCNSPVTVVGALTNNPAGAMMAFNEDGTQQEPIYAGEMVVIEGGDITKSLEFDLRTFYETSGLVEGLDLDSSTPPESLSEDLHGVWQEIQDALRLQGDFDERGNSEEIVINPGFIAPSPPVLAGREFNVDDFSERVFASFPPYEFSAAAAFHGTVTQVAAQADRSYAPGDTPIQGQSGDADLIAPITSARVSASVGARETSSPASGTGIQATGFSPEISPAATVNASTAAAVTSTPSPIDPVGLQPGIPTSTVPADAPPAIDNQPAQVVTAPESSIPEPVVTTAAVVTPPDNVPNQTANVPNQTANVPNQTANVPNQTANVPEQTVTVPEQTANLPEQPVNVPEQTTAPNDAVLSADQVPARTPASVDDFNLNTPGASSPEVLQTPD